jgi:hypothetical protein
VNSDFIDKKFAILIRNKFNIFFVDVLNNDNGNKFILVFQRLRLQLSLDLNYYGINIGVKGFVY